MFLTLWRSLVLFLLLVVMTVASIGVAGGKPSSLSDESANVRGPTEEKKLRIVIFGGHPDDPESGCGGLTGIIHTPAAFRRRRRRNGSFVGKMRSRAHRPLPPR